ncbi:helix-turn-helix domain-containing protein [Hankyongella ginsenosidimutans]|uniref:Helix-turn-helix domain-containing protein n=1 Tax=Hankyongella ginsenosidimutans TaxID=1763828 RepID=A0A4D7C5D2_9SPHN|nr:helix-turn-helix domain-containing protein [Hankyongella ginsenosidimutans]
MRSRASTPLAPSRAGSASPAGLCGEHRLRRALESLENGQAPADAAHECGFYDQPHLTRSLRRHLGVTPGMVRKRPSTSANRAP